MGDPNQGVYPGQASRQSLRAGPPASRSVVVPTVPRARGAHSALQCWLLTETFPFVFVSVSLSISVSNGLWLAPVSQHPSRCPGEQGWRGEAVGMRLCPVLTKDNKGRKGLAWRRLPALPALSSFTGPDPLPCPACQAPLVPVPVQGEPGPCGLRSLLALPHIHTALLVVVSLPAPGTALLGQPPHSPPFPHSVYSCFLSGTGGMGAGPLAREQEAGGNIWLPSVLQGWARPSIAQASRSEGRAEPQESRGQEVSIFALSPSGLLKPGYLPPTYLMMVIRWLGYLCQG